MCILRPLYAERYQSCQCICALPGDGERGAGEEGRGGGWVREKERERGCEREGERGRERGGEGGREGGRGGGREREGEAGRGREKGMVGLDHRCAFPRPHIAPPPPHPCPGPWYEAGSIHCTATPLGRAGCIGHPPGQRPRKGLDGMPPPLALSRSRPMRCVCVCVCVSSGRTMEEQY